MKKISIITLMTLSAFFINGAMATCVFNNKSNKNVIVSGNLIKAGSIKTLKQDCRKIFVKFNDKNIVKGVSLSVKTNIRQRLSTQKGQKQILIFPADFKFNPFAKCACSHKRWLTIENWHFRCEAGCNSPK